MALDCTSISLLLSEWTPAQIGGRMTQKCNLCDGERPLHNIGCVMDEALSDRLFMTTQERDAARVRLRFGGGIRCVHCGARELEATIGAPTPEDTGRPMWICRACKKLTPRAPSRVG